ncbi:eukaryotic translation initiation factor 2A-like [Tubulanus polymorphus]|uniref:eukaryotic translation initiation factor 2A-like n=1 Tax=Tubulanus polymorphus TaxID=672921 RepID=UPI003DA607F7
MSAPIVPPCVTLRGSDGIWMHYGPPTNKRKEDFRDTNKNCRCMAFSSDGNLFAYINGKFVIVVDLRSNAIVCQLQKPKTIFLEFSPKSTYLATWESYYVVAGTPQGQLGPNNLNIWDVKTGSLVKGFIQKNANNWCPQWSDDEGICSRTVTNEVHFYADGNFDTFKTKLRLEKLSDSCITKTGPPYYIATYVPGSKGQPSFVRLYKYPEFTGTNSIIANKSFFKAESVTMHWNFQGTAVLVLTSVESSADSYYGDQGLHFIPTNGDSSLVPLGKNGPVYHLEWNPKSPHFCVVYGFMPAKATLYNMKCEPVFDFGTGPRNFVHFNPFGSVLCLAGFGNLSGHIEFWDVKKHKLISKIKAADTTSFEWCPNGEYILTATTAPRLRVDNNFKIWHYTGSLVYDEKCQHSQELWEAVWQPVSAGTYQAPLIRYKPQENADTTVNEPKVQVYRPPGARGTPSTLKLHENEPPSNSKQNENLSKAALKNKKKREARKAKQEQELPVQTSHTPASSSTSDTLTTGDAEKDKKIRNLKKKIDAIEKLKQQLNEGKSLELNQLEKIKTEDKLRKELEAITLH